MGFASPALAGYAFIGQQGAANWNYGIRSATIHQKPVRPAADTKRPPNRYSRLCDSGSGGARRVRRWVRETFTRKLIMTHKRIAMLTSMAHRNEESLRKGFW